MRRLLFALLVVMIILPAYAQENETITIDYLYGKLTFDYYEKDGVKIPDGKMTYEKDGYDYKYTETGMCKDGYREGEWIIVGNKGNLTVIKTLNYRKGLLDGVCTIKEVQKNAKTGKETVYEESFNLKNGHLYGENIIKTTPNTKYEKQYYCNFDENGERCGVWKIVSNDKIIEAEYIQGEKVPINTYTVDILGQREEYKIPTMFNVEILSGLQHFDTKIKDALNGSPIDRKERINLPTSCKIPFGYIKSTETVKM